jgi:putative ABC transport system ATP-binding protein
VPFLFNDTIKKNILYSLLRKKGEDSDRLEEWIDLPGLENINQPEELDKKIINAVKDVGLFDDLYELGVQSKLMGDSDGTLADSKRKLLEARRRFLREIAKCGDQHVEFYRKEEFLEYCTVFENIVFSPSALIVQEFGSIKEFSRKYLNPLLKRTGLLERLFSMGIDLAREDIDLVESLYKKKSPLLSHLRMSTEQIKSKLRINEKIALQKEETIQMNQVDLSVVEDILDLAYNYVPGKSKENLLDDGLKRDILKQRYFFGENLPDAVKEKLKVFDSGAYMEVLSLRENIVFGNVNPSSRKANELINGLIRKIASEVGIEDLLLNLGLEFNVGERGSKLSGGQRQKVALARILLKEPSILILDEATANLDAASQARIVDLIGEKFNDKMVISIAHRLDTVKDYHEIVVFDKGQIVERGTFEELVNRDGLFRKLYSGSN